MKRAAFLWLLSLFIVTVAAQCDPTGGCTACDVDGVCSACPAGSQPLRYGALSVSGASFLTSNSGTRKLTQSYDMTIPPDGNHVYTASVTWDAVAKFDRSTTTGALTNPASIQPTGMDQPYGITSSPDNLHIYASSSVTDEVYAFSRNAMTGTLSALGSIASNGGTINMDRPTKMAIPADGAHVLVIATGSNSLVVLSRNAGTGLLSAASSYVHGTNGLNMDVPGGIAFSGTNVFVASWSGITKFTRNSMTGALTSAVTSFGGTSRLDVDILGSNLYALGYDGLASYDVDGSGVLSNEVEYTPTLDALLSGSRGMAVAPDGRSVHVVAVDGPAIVTFSRDTATGALSNAVSVIADGTQIRLSNPYAVVVAADGTSLHALGAASHTLLTMPRNSVGLGSLGCITCEPGNYMDTAGSALPCVPCDLSGGCTLCAANTGICTQCPFGSEPESSGAGCVTINECSTSPCLNGGTCVDATGAFVCSCAVGFLGTNCETNEDDCGMVTCANGGTCLDGVGSFVCACASGFFGPLCSQGPCDSSPCENGGTCVNGVGSFACACVAGFSGSTCAVIDNSCASSPCQNGGTCVDGSGTTFTCSCVAGYSGSTCAVNDDDCLPNPCNNGGTCVDGVDTYTCTCAAGFGGLDCANPTDSCAPNPCVNGGSCTDGTGSYVCSCVAGFTGLQCQVNTNECASSPCQNGGACSDGVNSVLCLCLPGFSAADCSVDIDGCSSTPCANGGTCSDVSGSPGGFQCACAAGFNGTDCATSGAMRATGLPWMSLVMFVVGAWVLC